MVLRRLVATPRSKWMEPAADWYYYQGDCLGARKKVAGKRLCAAVCSSSVRNGSTRANMGWLAASTFLGQREKKCVPLFGGIHCGE